MEAIKLDATVRVSAQVLEVRANFLLNQITEKTIQVITENGVRFNFDRKTGELRGGNGSLSVVSLDKIQERFEGKILRPLFKVTPVGLVTTAKRVVSDVVLDFTMAGFIQEEEVEDMDMAV